LSEFEEAAEVAAEEDEQSLHDDIGEIQIISEILDAQTKDLLAAAGMIKYFP
jgi:hypothetical protein